MRVRFKAKVEAKESTGLIHGLYNSVFNDYSIAQSTGLHSMAISTGLDPMVKSSMASEGLEL